MFITRTALNLFLFLSTVPLAALNISQYPASGLINTNRIRLIREYSIRHYGNDAFELKEPRMIVIHFTETSTLKEAVDYFLPDTLADDRMVISRFGKLNVGIHYFVDKNGDVLSFYPENMMARHIIGFNHTAIGIENIAENRNKLTDAQLDANAELIAQIRSRHPGIQYLIGHDEYSLTNLPHFRLYKAVDTNYRMLVKPDPGKDFMERLRSLLKVKYKLELID